MANERIFTIKINGVDKSYKDIGRLNDALDKLEQNSQKPFTIKIDGVERAFSDISDLMKSLKEMGESKKKVFTIQIDGIDKSFDDVTKLISQLEKLNKVNLSVSQTVEKVEKATKSQSKTIDEETKAENKLEQTRQRRLALDTDIAREQIAMNQQVRERQQQLQRSIQLENAEAGSIDEKRLQIGSLTGAYRALSEEERNSAHIGGAMLTQIQELRREYNELERSLGNHTVNVGNYESATAGLEGRFNSLAESVHKTAENTKGMLSMFQAGAGALALFGDESESSQKMLSDLGKIMAIVGALQAANNALLKDGVIASKSAVIIDGIHSVQIRARALSISLSNKNTVTAIVLQKALNLVQKASPLMWLLGAFVAIVGGITAYNLATGEATEQTKKYTSSLDGMSFATEEARDAHDEHLRKVRDLQIEYRVLTGDLTNYQAKLLEIANATSDAITENRKATVKELETIDEEYNSFFGKLGKSFTNYITGQDNKVSLESLEKERQEKRKKVIEDSQNKEINLQEIHNNKLKNEEVKHNKERIELQDKLASELKTGLDKDLFDLQNQRNKDLEEAKNKGVESQKVYEVYQKKEKEIRDKYRKEALSKAKENADKQKSIIESIAKYQEETTKVENQNILSQIEANRTKAKSIEEINATYKNQAEIIKKENASVVKSSIKDFDDLLEKAKGSAKKTADLTVLKNERVKALEDQLTNELNVLESERIEKIKEVNEKAVKNRQELLNLELSQLDTFFNSIESNLDNLETRNKNGVINVEATKKNIDEANRSLQEYLTHLQRTKVDVEKYYNEILALYPSDSLEYKQALLEKQNSLIDFRKKESEINKEITENTKKNTTLQSQYWKELGAKLQEYTDNVMIGVNSIFDATNALLQSQLDEANEKYDAISEKYDAVVEKREESNSRIQELENEAKNARGGRFLILQQQITQEMQTNQQLADQEKNLAKEKEKQEREIAKKEKQLKKVDLSQKLISGIANTALGVTQALGSAPPPLNLILAALVGASGAVQTGIIAKQISKLEDGGLLKGKRHSQGGMRIEGTNIEVEGDEFVVNRISTKKNLGLIKYINDQRRELTPTDINSFFSKSSQGFKPPFKRMLETGGQLPTITSSVNTNNKIIADAIRSIKIEPRVAVTDINNVQSDIVRVDSLTNL